MRTHLFQFDLAWEDKPANFRRVAELADGAGVAPGDLLVLPEMFDTGFSLNTERTADTDGTTLEFIRDFARSRRITLHGGRTVLGPDGRGRNLATVAGPDGAVLAEYAKVHPFSFGREPERFTGGDRVVTYDWTPPEGESVTGAQHSVKICPAVCYDLRFPELFRIGLLRGAQAFVLGANWPAPRAHHWRALLIARAIENQAFVLGVNRSGSDPHLSYSGGTMAVGPQGEVLGELGPEEGVLTVEPDMDALLRWRETFPAWRDVRLTRLDRSRASG